MKQHEAFHVNEPDFCISDIDTYQHLAERTSATADPGVRVATRMQHALYGCMTELGKLVDIAKREEFYGKPGTVVFDLDAPKAEKQPSIEEEIGDAMWYLMEAANANGLSMSVILGKNIEKLKRRFPEKFTGAAALSRADER